MSLAASKKAPSPVPSPSSLDFFSRIPHLSSSDSQDLAQQIIWLSRASNSVDVCFECSMNPNNSLLFSEFIDKIFEIDDDQLVSCKNNIEVLYLKLYLISVSWLSSCKFFFQMHFNIQEHFELKSEEILRKFCNLFKTDTWLLESISNIPKPYMEDLNVLIRKFPQKSFQIIRDRCRGEITREELYYVLDYLLTDMSESKIYCFFSLLQSLDPSIFPTIEDEESFIELVNEEIQNISNSSLSFMNTGMMISLLNFFEEKGWLRNKEIVEKKNKLESENRPSLDQMIAEARSLPKLESLTQTIDKIDKLYFNDSSTLEKIEKRIKKIKADFNCLSEADKDLVKKKLDSIA